MAQSPLPIAARIAQHLRRLYPSAQVEETTRRLLDVAARHQRSTPTIAHEEGPPWRPLDERDVWLIAYGDHLTNGTTEPLAVLGTALEGPLADVASGIHLLPFYPSTSDDGFAVVDHRVVDPAIGGWDLVRAIGAHRRLMVDAVVNHVSASSPHVREWSGHVLEPADGFDSSAVVRPRTSPLFTPFQRPDGGVRYAWTTFSTDQIDLDYTSPDVLVDMTDALLGYTAQGASVIRLDAVGFLWKASGSTCIHEPETHEIVRLWRTLVDHFVPGTLLITETNVPHEENVAYLGDGRDEAHLVYQFALPPLVLAAFVWGNAQEVTRWAAALDPPPGGTSFLNFLASHDGIGLRAVEGRLSDTQIDGLCDLARGVGGGVSYRSTAMGRQLPYELNTTFVDALDGVADDEHGLRRVLGAHAILLAFQGVPGLWLGSVLGERNWIDGVRETGRLRTINRRRLSIEEVHERVEDPSGFTGSLFDGLRRLVALRSASPAFAPSSPQQVLAGPQWLFGLIRGQGEDRRMVLVSVSDRARSVDPSALSPGRWTNHLGDPTRVLGEGEVLELEPYGVAWLGPAVRQR